MATYIHALTAQLNITDSNHPFFAPWLIGAFALFGVAALADADIETEADALLGDATFSETDPETAVDVLIPAVEDRVVEDVVGEDDPLVTTIELQSVEPSKSTHRP